MIYTETLSNPTLVVADIPRLAAIARAKVRALRAWRDVHAALQSVAHVMPARALPLLRVTLPNKSDAFFPLKQGLKLVVDNTFTPLILSPLR